MSEIPKLQDADLKGKVVLVRVDHNVAKEHVIRDPFRIDITFGTLFNILSKGGRLILMTHVGRPRDKKTGRISRDSNYDVKPIVDYLERKLYTRFIVPEFEWDSIEGGYAGIDTSVNLLIKELRAGRIDGIYLPNVRWFKGEESGDYKAQKLGEQLAGLADVYVNDAIGSWRPHTSTVRVPEYLPSYAGYLMQHEILGLNHIFSPRSPLLAIIAGSKFDTKIGPLSFLLDKVDYLMLGGVIYNAYLSMKYDVQIKGIDEEDLLYAKEFVKGAQRNPDKIIEPPYIIESDTLEGRFEGQYRIHDIRQLKPGTKLNYVVDVSEKSFELPFIIEPIMEMKSIFVNAVMGYTKYFEEGTKQLYSLVDQNKRAFKMFAGGDTLQELRSMLPGIYIRAVDADDYYFFSGGGTILKAIHAGCITGLDPVQALINNGGKEAPRVNQHLNN